MKYLAALLLLAPILLFSQNTTDTTASEYTKAKQSIAESKKRDTTKKTFQFPDLGIYLYFGKPAMNGFGFRYSDFGLDLGIDSYESDLPIPQYDYEIPHNDYYLKTGTGNKLSIGLVYYLKVGDLDITPVIGYSEVLTRTIKVSNASRWTYKDSESAKNTFYYGLGANYKVYKAIVLGAKWDVVTKFGLVLGFKF